MDSLSLSSETYKSLLPACAPGESVTITIEGANGDTARLSGTITQAPDGITVPLVAEGEGPSEDARTDETEPGEAKTGSMSAGAAAAMGTGTRY